MSVRDHILTNFWLKLISFVLASLIWVAVRTNTGSETKPPQRFALADETHQFQSQAVMLMTEPGDRRALSVRPETVDVTLRATKIVMQGLQPRDILVYVRVPSDAQTVHPVPVTVDVPTGVVLERVSPPAVIVAQAENP